MIQLERELNASANRGAEHIVKYCAKINGRDTVLIIYDRETLPVAKFLFECAKTVSSNVLFAESASAQNAAPVLARRVRASEASFPVFRHQPYRSPG